MASITQKSEKLQVLVYWVRFVAKTIPKLFFRLPFFIEFLSEYAGIFPTATTQIKRQLISGDDSNQSTTHIKRQLISSDNSFQSKLASQN